jgi:hypothetical protein
LSTVALCPACRGPVAAKGEVPQLCPHCQHELPPELRAAIDFALRSARPAGVTFTMWATGIIGVFYLAIGLLALSGVGSYKIEDRAVSQQEFLAATGPLLLPSTIVLLLTCWGISRQRSWPRYTAASFWVVMIICWALFPSVPTEPIGLVGCQVLPLFVGLFVSVWYFFVKPNVVAYYQHISRSAQLRGMSPNQVGAENNESTETANPGSRDHE